MAPLIFWCEKCNKHVSHITQKPSHWDAMEFEVRCHDAVEAHSITAYEILANPHPIFTYCFKNAIENRDDNQTQQPDPQGVSVIC
jgi:hypothetical protein